MSLDVERLHVVLQQSFSPDANLRNPAETTIRNLKHLKGSTVLLLQIAAEKQVSEVFVGSIRLIHSDRRKDWMDDCILMNK